MITGVFLWRGKTRAYVQSHGCGLANCRRLLEKLGGTLEHINSVRGESQNFVRIHAARPLKQCFRQSYLVSSQGNLACSIPLQWDQREQFRYRPERHVTKRCRNDVALCNDIAFVRTAQNLRCGRGTRVEVNKAPRHASAMQLRRGQGFPALASAIGGSKPYRAKQRSYRPYRADPYAPLSCGHFHPRRRVFSMPSEEQQPDQ